MDRVLIPEAEIPPMDTGRFKKPFNVRVFNVSNPYHFYVQPLETVSALNSLEHRLKVFQPFKHNYYNYLNVFEF